MHSRPDAIVLCGGAGSRLRVLTDSPKAMVPVGGRPFLEFLLRQLRRWGIERVILATGYRGDVIQSHFGEEACGLELVYSPEGTPLGTGGALRNAAGLVRSSAALVLNGDSYTDADLHRFVLGHQESKADMSVLVVPPDGREDCGNVSVGADGGVRAFREKYSHTGPLYMNAGIYLFSGSILREIPSGSEVSLERELFPQWLEEGKVIKAIVDRTTCYDIGTPERYLRAQTALAPADIRPDREVVGER